MKKILYYLACIAFFVALDQISKTFLISHLKTQTDYMIEVLPFFDLVYAWNYGISFGMFSEHHQYSNMIFLGLNSIIITYLCYMTITTKACLARIGLLLIISGAIGNLIDRIIRGAVFDFLYFYYENLAFPAFNLADAFITIGACIFIYDYLFCQKKKT